MMQKNSVYDKRFYLRGLFALFALIAAMKFTGGTGFLFIFPVVFMAFAKNKTELLLACLMVTSIVTMGNVNFMPKNSVFSVANRLLYVLVGGVMFFQMVGMKASRTTTPFLVLLVYLCYMALISSFGWNPLISYLKLILFTVVFLAYYLSANAALACGARPERLRSAILIVASFLIFGSVALLPFPSLATLNVGYYVQNNLPIPEGSLFTGVTFQSQALGPLVSIFATLLLADLCFSVGRFNRLYGVLLLCTPILIYKTGSRTAMGTYLAGLFFVLFLFMCAKTSRVRAVWKQRVLSTAMMCGMVFSMVLAATPEFRQGIVNFVYKSRTADVLEENQGFDKFISSRQGLIDESMENFHASPWIGNGFQVSRRMADLEIRSWMQLLSAPIEKGVWVTAILEEGGIFGMALFVLFIVVVFSLLLARRAYIATSVLFVFLVMNLGEFDFFAMSSTGGVAWAMVFIATALDTQREQLWKGGSDVGVGPYYNCWR